MSRIGAGFVGAAVCAAVLFAAGAAAAAERYVEVPKITVRFAPSNWTIYTMVLRLEVAVRGDDALTAARRDRHRIERALLAAYQAETVDRYVDGNLAVTLKRLGRRALRDGEFGYVDDVLIRSAVFR